MDEALYRVSLEDEVSQNPMTDKEVLYVQDSNGGSYNGQINFDTSTLSNSGRWMAYSEGTIEIPFVMTYKSSVDSSAAGVINGYMAGLKSGSHHLIDSISVDYNNTNVVQLQSFTNFFVGYKVMTSWSQDDLTKWGDICGVAPDDSDSFQYSAAAARDGDGTSNNRVALVAAGTNVFRNQASGHNEGLYKRLHNTAYPLTSNDTGFGANPEVGTASRANAIGLNYVSDNAGAAAARVWSWNIIATIRLKDLCDFFDKLPLIKGGFMRIQINYNSFDASITSAAAAAPTMALAASGLTSRSGRTNPMMISSANALNPGAGLLDGTNTFACGVVSCTNSAASHPLLPSCRLQVPAYKLDAAREQELLSIQPVREVEYEDIYNYNIQSVAADGSFNSILTNGLVGVKKLVVIPQLSGTQANVGWANANTNPPYQSPFDSSPATTAPLALIPQFNVSVGGTNIFQRNKQYDYETFCDEVSRSNCIDGGASTGLSCGLLSYKDWKYGYRYYVADISRRVAAEDAVPKSVVVQGVNGTAKVMDYICFITFLRKIKIDMATGALRQ